MGGVSAGATYDVIFSTRASLRRFRTCLLAFHVSEEYPHDDVIAEEFDQHLPTAEFPGSMSDDVMIAGRNDAPMSMSEDDVNNVIDHMTKNESRSTLDYKRAESVV